MKNSAGSSYSLTWTHFGEFAENGVWTPTETYLKEKYASIVGAVIYLSITCRNDSK